NPHITTRFGPTFGHHRRTCGPHHAHPPSPAGRPRGPRGDLPGRTQPPAPPRDTFRVAPHPPFPRSDPCTRWAAHPCALSRAPHPRRSTMTTHNHAGTPLTRYGRRVVVTPPVTPARTARRTATVTATAPATPVNPVV